MPELNSRRRSYIDKAEAWVRGGTESIEQAEVSSGENSSCAQQE